MSGRRGLINDKNVNRPRKKSAAASEDVNIGLGMGGVAQRVGTETNLYLSAL